MQNNTSVATRKVIRARVSRKPRASLSYSGDPKNLMQLYEISTDMAKKAIASSPSKPVVIEHDDNQEVGRIVSSGLDESTGDWLVDFEITNDGLPGKQLQSLWDAGLLHDVSIKFNRLTGDVAHLAVCWKGVLDDSNIFLDTATSSSKQTQAQAQAQAPPSTHTANTASINQDLHKQHTQMISASISQLPQPFLSPMMMMPQHQQFQPAQATSMGIPAGMPASIPSGLQSALAPQSALESYFAAKFGGDVSRITNPSMSEQLSAQGVFTPEQYMYRQNMMNQQQMQQQQLQQQQQQQYQQQLMQQQFMQQMKQHQLQQQQSDSQNPFNLSNTSSSSSQAQKGQSETTQPQAQSSPQVSNSSSIMSQDSSPAVSSSSETQASPPAVASSSSVPSSSSSSSSSASLSSDPNYVKERISAMLTSRIPSQQDRVAVTDIALKSIEENQKLRGEVDKLKKHADQSSRQFQTVVVEFMKRQLGAERLGKNFDNETSRALLQGEAIDNDEFASIAKEPMMAASMSALQQLDDQAKLIKFQQQQLATYAMALPHNPNAHSSAPFMNPFPMPQYGNVSYPMQTQNNELDSETQKRLQLLNKVFPDHTNNQSDSHDYITASAGQLQRGSKRAQSQSQPQQQQHSQGLNRVDEMANLAAKPAGWMRSNLVPDRMKSLFSKYVNDDVGDTIRPEHFLNDEQLRQRRYAGATGGSDTGAVADTKRRPVAHRPEEHGADFYESFRRIN